MALESSPSAPPARRAYRDAARLPAPPEGAQLIALTALARRAGAGTGHGAMVWDARIEASLRAVHAYLVRRGLGEKWAGPHGSGRYACSLEQLVVGLAPLMGWDGVPPAHTSARARFVAAHRASVQRWLDWLQAAGLVSHTPQRDGRGRWWRTVIELHEVPDVDVGLLGAARRRVAGWSRAERRRRARGRRRDLSALIARSRLTRAQRRARSLRHARAAKLAVERREVRAVLASLTHLRHPSGALANARGSLDDDPHDEALVREVTRVDARPPDSAQATQGGHIVTEETEAGEDRAAGVTVVGEVVSTWRLADEAYQAADEAEAEDLEPGAVAGGRVDAVLVGAAREGRRSDVVGLRERAVAARRQEVADWPAGRPLPAWRLSEAWAAARWGDRAAAMSGVRLARWPARRWSDRLARASAAYEAHAQLRPPHWPPSAPAALIALADAEQRAWARGDHETGAQSLAAHVRRLERVVRMMRAAHRVLADPERERHARDRALKRAQRTRATWRGLRDDPDPEQLHGAGWEEIRRRHTRDEALIAGHPPEHDGTLLALEAYVACFGDPADIVAARAQGAEPPAVRGPAWARPTAPRTQDGRGRNRPTRRAEDDDLAELDGLYDLGRPRQKPREAAARAAWDDERSAGDQSGGPARSGAQRAK